MKTNSKKKTMVCLSVLFIKIFNSNIAETVIY